ncbi:MAG: DUF4249 domain-containing protein [Bacteroidales bacterium]|jgi:hypothetical protein
MRLIFSLKYFPIITLVLVLVLLVLSSCQKVITIDLNSAAPQTVIEGNISDQPGPCVVKLTQTVNYSQTNNFPPITGAVVTISDNVGNTATLTESPAGTYTTSAIQGVPGRTYNLTITANGNNYTSSSTMPYPVNIDTIVFAKNRFGGDSKRLAAKFLDPAGIANYYALFVKLNNAIQPDFSSADDNLRDGDTISMRVPFSDTFIPASGDSITVILESIDKNVREYDRLLLQLNNSGGFESAPPANPVSNISNNALGYFNAHSDRKKIFVVP